MRLFLLLCVAALCSACETMKTPIAPSKGPWKLTGSIASMAGARLGPPVVGAELTVTSGVNSNARVMTDHSGHFAFDALETDKFTVAINAPGFVGLTPFVNLFGDTDVTFVLKPR
jgi:hypothetical protein